MWQGALPVFILSQLRFEHPTLEYFLFVCLFGCVHPTRKIFTHIETSPFLTYARHSWPLSSEGSLACHTYCDTGHPLIMVISEEHCTCCREFGSGAVTTCFYNYTCRGLDTNTQPSTCEENTLTDCATAASPSNITYCSTYLYLYVC